MAAERFAGLAGNAEVKRQIAAFADTGEFPHALLIEGAVGSGRRTFASYIAKAAVCTAEQGRPCGVCAACRKAENGHHPDVAVYGGDGGARSFHVDTVRALRESAYVLPNESEKRVLLLIGADTMTEQAQNALLRILEEPPRHLLFLLTCENRARLLPTILSRVQCLSLSGASEEEALPILRERLPDVEERELRRALLVFDGCIGRVIDAMEGDTFPQILQTVSAMAEALLSPTELPFLKLTAPMDRDRPLTEGVLAGLLPLFRDALCAKQGQTTWLSTAPELAQRLAQTFTSAQLMRMMNEVQALQRAQQTNTSSPLLLSLLSARLFAAAGR